MELGLIRYRKMCVQEILFDNRDVMASCDMLYMTSSNPNQTINYSEVQLNGESAVKTMVAHPAFKGKTSPDHFTEHRFQHSFQSRIETCFVLTQN
jgi:hypothetical protein